MTLKIKTNNQYREIIYWCELTDQEQNELKGLYDTIEESSFFRYRGRVYDLNDFMRIENHMDDCFSSWHGYHSDSYFSGILIKLSNCGEAVKVGYYVS